MNGAVGAQPGTSEGALRIAREASQTVGDTPLVAVQRLTEGIDAEVVAKLEYLSPGGSVKDRIGVAMIDAAEPLPHALQDHERRVANRAGSLARDRDGLLGNSGLCGHRATV